MAITLIWCSGTDKSVWNGIYTVQYSWNGPIFPRQVNITKAPVPSEAYGFSGANLKIGVIPISVRVYTAALRQYTVHICSDCLGVSSGEQNNAESDNII